jgi:hypothetical protein
MALDAQAVIARAATAARRKTDRFMTVGSGGNEIESIQLNRFNLNRFKKRVL